MRYKHVFFDLDRTLWDFDTNSRLALHRVYEKHQLEKAGVPDALTFIDVYEAVNEKMWKAYRMGNLSKKQLRERRFSEALSHFGCLDTALGGRLDSSYLTISPQQTALLPEAIETLDYLSGKYQMHIITNGFEEVQEIKMKKSGLSPFFNTLLTSERAKARKPDSVVFELACKMAGTSPSESIMIGDDLQADVLGAKKVNMDQVYFNPQSVLHDADITHEIKQLNELRAIL